ncbi:MAG: hypothetical protein KKA42_01995 [candidate division Zixibacteria bacterium]|nr:hypothetical protein [candidate division Zixibacteria bacterium]
MMRRTLVITVCLLTLWGLTDVVRSEDAPVPAPDSTLPIDFPDTSAAPVLIDSVALADTLTLLDSIRLVFPEVDPDTLTEPQRRLVEFETRFRLRQADQPVQEPIPDVFSYADSLNRYLVSERWNLRENIDRSMYRDAGDYFKFNSAFTLMDHQSTPMRKTVQPYGLAGNRLAILSGGWPLSPFEHILEPDGLVDMNDIPTAQDDRVAILPGPVGLVLGASHSTATLYTQPKQMETTIPESSFLVDKGWYSFSYARGRYSKLFSNGRHIDASLGYRKADGLFVGRGDDQYYYSGDFYFPFGGNKSFQAVGWLYDRHGPFLVRPDSLGVSVTRDRIDRRVTLSAARYSDDLSSTGRLSYTHIRQASVIGGRVQSSDVYRMNGNYTGHGLSASREWSRGNILIKAEGGADYLEYFDWYDTRIRRTAFAGLNAASITGPWRWAITARQTYDDAYDFLPLASAVIARDGERSLVMLSASYSERAPSLYELYHRYQEARIYGTDLVDYADEGNRNLKSEHQLMGSGQIILGPLGRSLGVTVTAGKITDGIDWWATQNGDVTEFRPANNDIEFVSIAADTRYRLFSLLHVLGGGGYNSITYEHGVERPYTPEYQLFGGAELHVYWPQKLIDLWAYGELQYTGPYRGYSGRPLGEEVVANVKFSVQMGSFRFNWMIQNALDNIYETREYYRAGGRYVYWGFVWDFLN